MEKAELQEAERRAQGALQTKAKAASESIPAWKKHKATDQRAKDEAHQLNIIHKLL